jgi:RimJ/RimL family protein N-acetyltransferase
MQLAEFIATHAPALEHDEARHNLILGILGRAANGSLPLLTTWTLGAPSACAVQAQGRVIVLGELGRNECRALAEATRGLEYPGVVGQDLAPSWFVERAAELGLAFADPIPQRIHALRKKPVYPGSQGYVRIVGPADVSIFADWMIAFATEAVPHDPVSTREELARLAAERRHMLWIAGDEPVSMAGISRRLRSTAAISAVYTPPSRRGRGYAGSITAAVADRIFVEGKTSACLYTDLRNPVSNRCYARIGFEPVCDSWFYLRRPPQA